MEILDKESCVLLYRLVSVVLMIFVVYLVWFCTTESLGEVYALLATARNDGVGDDGVETHRLGTAGRNHKTAANKLLSSPHL